MSLVNLGCIHQNRKHSRFCPDCGEARPELHFPLYITMYAHITKEYAHMQGEKAGLEEERLRNFTYAGGEHKMIYEVDEHGGAVLIAVDDRLLAPVPHRAR